MPFLGMCRCSKWASTSYGRGRSKYCVVKGWSVRLRTEIHMKTRCLLVMVIGVFLVAGMTMAQGPKKDIGKDVPLPPTNSERSIGKDQGKEQPPQVPSLSIDVDVVSFDVVVTDQSGNPISGLEKQHFKIFDDNVEQTVSNFSPTDAPLTVV